MTLQNQGSLRQERDTNRLETFSDGVFAIAITLLVLNIHISSGASNLLSDLGSQWPSYLAYLLSFIMYRVEAADQKHRASKEINM